MNPIDSLRKSRLAMWFRIPYRRIFRKLEDNGLSKDHHLRFLEQSHGILHVGANTGQEAWIYALMKKPVCWFEPIPDVYERLAANISQYKGQRAFNELITDETGKSYEFHLANNDGASSSIFEFDLCQSMYPDVAYTSSIAIPSITLDDALDKYGIPKRFDALVMDTQGSELLILKGAEKTLGQVRWIYLECADFSSYKGGCVCSEISEFLLQRGFAEAARHLDKSVENVGNYYNVLYRRG